MGEGIIFKGDKEGLKIVWDETLDFVALVEQLSIKLESAAAFFTSETNVYLPEVDNLFSPDERNVIGDLFAKYGLCLSAQEEADEKLIAARKDDQPLIVGKTLRSGQEIISHGCVEIFGDVNPGARVIAAGNIVIHGICRGVAHAGANGDRGATITADKMLASQLRIADMIARAPDHLDDTEYVERACVRDGIVIIEPAN